jgi:hypothetical protein
MRSLEVADIDSKRMVAHMRDIKNHNDRIVDMPLKALDALRVYWKAERPEGTALFGACRGGRDLTRDAVNVAVRTTAVRAVGFVALLLGAFGCAEPLRPPTNGAPPPPDDVPSFGPRDALPVRPASDCGGTRVALVQQRAEVMLVVDRSGSMNEPDADGSRKWPTLVAVLRDVLPRVEANVAVGLLMFPVGQDEGGAKVACTRAPTVAVSPAFNNAAAVLAALDPVTPGGGTPTFAAVNAAGGYFTAAPDPLGRRYVLLATDGAPNCNRDLDPSTCVCAAPDFACQPTWPHYRESCLDDVRTLAALRALSARGIGTFVVGLLGVESMAGVLDAMAVAGGHPLEGPRRFHSAASGTALASALRGITSALVDCRFRLDAAPPDPDLVDVRLGDSRLVRDPARRDGWGWSDDSHREIAFFGPTCERVRGESGGVVLAAAFGCPAATPP